MDSCEMKSLPPSAAKFFKWLAAPILPAVASLDAQAAGEFLRIIDDALLSRPPVIRKRIAVFLFILRYSCVFRFGAPLDRLDARKIERVLRWFQNNPFFLFRAGFWGLKTLVFMGYYGRPEIGPAIRYTPVLFGNERLDA